MLGSREEQARFHSDFYRNSFRKLLRWLMISMVIVFMLIALIIYLVLFKAPQQYYANTSEGLIFKMPPPNA